MSGRTRKRSFDRQKVRIPDPPLANTVASSESNKMFRGLKCNRRIFLLALLTLSSCFCLHFYLCRHHPMEAIYGRELYVYRDGSHHPFTSLLAQKLEGDFIFGKKAVRWRWQPQKFVDSTHLGAQLTADPSTLNNGEVTTVRWTNTPPGIKMDILALYCPQNSSSYRFTDFWYVDSFPGLDPKKDGEVKIALFDVRLSCEFRMFFVRSDSVEVVAISSRIDFIEKPLHLHLGLTGVPSQMRVQWTSRHPYTPTVFYGLTPTELKYTATGLWKTYTNKDMCGPPANSTTFFLHPGYLHDVLLTGLKANTRYYYRCGGGVNFELSSVRNFTTALVKGSPDTFQFVVYGDMDITSHPGAETTAELLLKEATKKDSLSFVLHIGDTSYANGFSYRWDEWMTMIEPYSSLVPYMVSIGNHDQVTAKGLNKDPSGNSSVVHKGSLHDSGGECGVPLHLRFHMPENGNHLWWYSFDYGSAHIIQLSSEHDLSPGSLQYSWLRKDLMKVDGSVTPWKIVTIHRPMYSSVNEYLKGQQIREDIEDTLSENNVDLIITAHDHAYERTCSVYRSKCDERRGIVNIVVGTGGMQLDSNDIWMGDWSRHFEVNFGYGRTTVNRTDLLWEFVRNKDKVVTDSIKLRKIL